MSEKQNVPTFRISLTHLTDEFEGPVVSPDKQQFARDLPDVHQFLRLEQAILVHDKEWIYVPMSSVRLIRRGKRRFDLPWPLV